MTVAPLSMHGQTLVYSRRIRTTPFEQRIFENGVREVSVYNHMTLASVYRSLVEDYEHLRRHVQVWDVSCQRQVEVVGADALALVELATPREISCCDIGQCLYTPLVDENGGIVNDPVILRLDTDRFWISVADSDVLLWLKGLAAGRGLNVRVFEPDVSPLAIQGPRSEDLMERLAGPGVRELRAFRFIRCELAGTSVVLARSGWSGQGGFEIYLQDSSRGLELWDLVWTQGRPFNIRAGCPNLIERLEAGLLSYGSDMTLDSNPMECGLDRFFRLGKAAEYLSRDALDRISREGVRRRLVHLLVPGDAVPAPRSVYRVSDSSGHPAGRVTSLAWSPRFRGNLSFATVDVSVSEPGTVLTVHTSDGAREGSVRNRAWQ